MRGEVGRGAPQEFARTAFPWQAVGGEYVADKEMLGSRSIAKVDSHFSRAVRHYATSRATSGARPSQRANWRHVSAEASAGSVLRKNTTTVMPFQEQIE
jgi:hypothetical protein